MIKNGGSGTRSDDQKHALNNEDRVLVEMLEPGYAGLSEYVYISQIVGLEK